MLLIEFKYIIKKDNELIKIFCSITIFIIFEKNANEYYI